MRLVAVVFCLVVACAVSYAQYENGPVVGILQGEPVEAVPQNKLVYVQPAHSRQKRGLLLGAGLLGAGVLGAGVLGAGALGAGVLGAGLIGAKAGLVGGAIAGRALSHGYGGYGGYGGYYGGYGGHYGGDYYVVDEGYGW